MQIEVFVPEEPKKEERKKKSPRGLEMKYFVLKPRSKEYDDVYARASREALRTYAIIIREENELLSDDLLRWTEYEEELYKKKVEESLYDRFKQQCS